MRTGHSCVLAATVLTCAPWHRYTGHKNNQYRLESCLSNTDAHVITGSEDGHIYCYDLVDVNYWGLPCAYCVNTL